MFDRVWLIGEGRWGSRIRDSLIELGVSVKIIDIRHGKSIWDVDDFDPIIIATPTPDHHRHAEYFLTRGHDIFIEKPACETPDQIRSLIAMQAKDQIVMPGHIYRFNPLLDELSFIIKSGQLGDIKFVHSERLNLGTYQSRNMLINNIGLHDLTLIEYLWGITSIDAVRSTDITGNGVPDRMCVLGKSNGINWQLDISWLSAVRRRMFVVAGTLAQAVWDEDQRSIIITKTDTSSGMLEYERLLPIKAQGRLPLTLELEHFLKCCEDRSKPKVNLQDSLRISELIAEAERLGTSASIFPNH
jgi:predicted dehydrogenase